MLTYRPSQGRIEPLGVCEIWALIKLQVVAVVSCMLIFWTVFGHAGVPFTALSHYLITNDKGFATPCLIIFKSIPSDVNLKETSSTKYLHK